MGEPTVKRATPAQRRVLVEMVERQIKFSVYRSAYIFADDDSAQRLPWATITILKRDGWIIKSGQNYVISTAGLKLILDIAKRGRGKAI